MAQQDEDRVGIRLSREPAFQLGSIDVHPATRQIVRDGSSETLEPRIMQVLVAFAQSEGEILAHDELIDRCWDGRIVGENAIHRAVSKVRDLGANFGGGAFAIETITKVGYRMSLRWKDAPAHPAALKPRQAGAEIQSPGRRSRRWVIGAALTGSVVGVAGVGSWLLGADPMDARVADLVERSDQAIRNGLPDSDAQGVGFLEEAAALQPGNARVWGRLALARFIVAEHAPPAEAGDAVAATQDAARRALALDPRQVDARSALALLPPYYGDWLAAENRMKAVLALDPRHLPTRDARSFMYVAVGRAREGSSDRLLTAAQEPLHVGQQFKLIYSHWILGDIGAADRAADRALHLWPKHPGVWFARLWTLAFTGRAALALAHVEDETARLELPPEMIEMLRLSMTALHSRRPADVERATASVLGLLSKGPSHSVNAVLLLTGLGEIDRAFDVTSAYLLERGPLMASVRWRAGQISVNDQRRRKTNMLFVPVSAPMRADRRFAKLVAQIGLASYWERAGITPDYLA